MCQAVAPHHRHCVLFCLHWSDDRSCVCLCVWICVYVQVCLYINEWNVCVVRWHSVYAYVWVFCVCVCECVCQCRQRESLRSELAAVQTTVTHTPTDAILIVYMLECRTFIFINFGRWLEGIDCIICFILWTTWLSIPVQVVSSMPSSYLPTPTPSQVIMTTYRKPGSITWLTESGFSSQLYSSSDANVLMFWSIQDFPSFIKLMHYSCNIITVWFMVLNDDRNIKRIRLLSLGVVLWLRLNTTSIPYELIYMSCFFVLISWHIYETIHKHNNFSIVFANYNCLEVYEAL